jgi:RNA polymerase sigma-70 factor (ECF subfamily)
MPTRSGVRGINRGSTVLRLKREPINDIVQALSVHAGLIMGVAARILGDLAEAEDIAQDIAEKLLRRPPKEITSWPALLKTMAVNAAIDRTRRRRESSDPAELITHDGPEQRVMRQQQAAALRDALRQLPRRDATLFSLFYLADLPQSEIAQLMDMNRSAVGVALYRVRQRLADLIDPSFKYDNVRDSSP